MYLGKLTYGGELKMWFNNINSLMYFLLSEKEEERECTEERASA